MIMTGKAFFGLRDLTVSHCNCCSVRLSVLDDWSRLSLLSPLVYEDFLSRKNWVDVAQTRRMVHIFPASSVDRTGTERSYTDI